MNVVGVDPGKMTGIFCSGWPSVGWEVEPDQVTRVLDELRDCPGIDVLAMETYIMRPSGRGNRKTAQPEALDVMGRVRQYATDHRIPLLEAQPSTTKRIVPDRLLRRARWYRVTRDGHSNDAARVVGWAILVRDPERFAQIFKI